MRTVDTNVTDGRSYISVVSEVVRDDLNYTCLGKAKKNMGEARMDIVNSEIAYLGFYDSESYGLTWKVGKALSYGKEGGIMPSSLLRHLVLK